MKESYRDSHKADNHGYNYDKSLYTSDTFDKRIWDLIEKDILSDFLSKYKIDSYLDFACGTGRITSFLEDNFNKSTGIDVSEEMLKIAEKKCMKTKFILGDITNKNFRSSIKEKFNLITSYRFFANSEQSLREDIMKEITFLLDDDGYFIFNNHRNKYSWIGIYGFLRKLIQPSWSYNLLSNKTINKLLEENNMEIVKMYNYGYLPFSHSWKRIWYFPFIHSNIITKNRWQWIEKKLTFKTGLGSHYTFICRKKQKKTIS